MNYHQSEFRGDGFYAFVYRYQNISGRANYVYKDKYIGELGFSYFGSDAFCTGQPLGILIRQYRQDGSCRKRRSGRKHYGEFPEVAGIGW